MSRRWSWAPWLMLLVALVGACASRGPVQDSLKPDLTICEAMIVLARNVSKEPKGQAARTYIENLAISFRATTCGPGERRMTEEMIGIAATEAVRTLKLGSELDPTQRAALFTVEKRLKAMLDPRCSCAKLPALLDRVARNLDGICQSPPTGDWLTHVEDLEKVEEAEAKHRLEAECILRYANPAALIAYLGLDSTGACSENSVLAVKLLNLACVADDDCWSTRLSQ